MAQFDNKEPFPYIIWILNILPCLLPDSFDQHFLVTVINSSFVFFFCQEVDFPIFEFLYHGDFLFRVHRGCKITKASSIALKYM